jgi:hypothetical protein
MASSMSCASSCLVVTGMTFLDVGWRCNEPGHPDSGRAGHQDYGATERVEAQVSVSVPDSSGFWGLTGRTPDVLASPSLLDTTTGRL